MNISLRSTQIPLTAALIATVASLTWTSSTLAQEKGAELLAKRQTTGLTTTSASANTSPAARMDCPKCQDKTTRVAQPPGKGGRLETALVVRHQCPGCAVKRETVGVGKQATSTVKHVCTQAEMASMNCCGTQHGNH